MKLDYKITLKCCYMAYVVQAISINFLPLLFVIMSSMYGISLPQLSVLILITFSAQLIADVLAIKVLDIIGYRGTMIISLSLATIGLTMIGCLPWAKMGAYTYIIICNIFLAAGGGLMEAVLSPITEDLPIQSKKTTMATLHSFYCWGFLFVVIITTTFLRIAGHNNWFYLAFVWAVVPLITLVFFTFIPIGKPLEKSQRTPIKQLLFSPLFLICVLVMICSGASEMIISQWASLFAEKGLGISKLKGDIFGAGTFALLMALGRVAYGVWGEKISLNKVLLVGSIGTVVCFLGASLIPNAYIAVIFYGLSGLFVCMLWPGTFSASSALFPKASYFLFSLLAFSGDIGCSIGPSLSGWVADKFSNMEVATSIASRLSMTTEQVGLRAGILIGSIFPIALVVCVVVLNKQTKKSSEQVKQLLQADLTDN